MVQPSFPLHAQNFREIAGLPAGDGRRLRRGMLYRTGDLSRLRTECVESLRHLGIRSIIDLRSAQERESRPYSWLDEIDAEAWGDSNATSSASLHGLIRKSEASADEARAAMAFLYTRVPFTHAQSIGEIGRRIIAGRAPVLFGCAAGKDRTGVAAALLLWQIGVPKQAIFADYLATNEAQDGLASMFEKAFGCDTRAPHVRAVMLADPSYLEAMFSEVEQRYGSIEQYFETVLGIDEQGRREIRMALTEGETREAAGREQAVNGDQQC